MDILLKLCLPLFISCLTASSIDGAMENTISVATALDNQRPRNQNDPQGTKGGSVSSTHRDRQVHRSFLGKQWLVDGRDTIETRDSVSHQRDSPDVNSSSGNTTVPCGVYSENDRNCVCTKATQRCRTIPSKIQPGVTTLKVMFQDTAIPDGIFNDLSYTNLSHLYLNGVGLDKFSNSSFTGLKSLHTLSLTGMDRLHGLSLQFAMLREDVLPKMKHFTLNPGPSFASPFLKVKCDFVKKLANNIMESVSVINVITEITTSICDLIYLLNVGEFLNLTSSFVVLDFPSQNRYANSHYYQPRKPLLKVLDATRLRVTYTDSPSTNGVYIYTNANTPQCNGTHDFSIFPMFFLVEIWYANGIFTERTQLEGFCDFSKGDVFLKNISFSGNEIPKLNVSLLFPSNNSVRFANLSNNGFEYINPGLFRTMIAIKELYVSKNKLYHMEHSPEFETLLTHMRQLEVFDLANNNIAFIPSGMFQSNTRLDTLILANNRLSSISFDLRNLTQLRILDVRYNAIVTLADSAINKLQELIQERQFSILFAGNPIQCTCKHVTFISWLVSLRVAANERILCHYGRDYIEVDNDAVGKCKFLCNRTLIIAVSSVCSIAAVVLIVAVGLMVRIVKTRRKQRNMEWRLRQIIEGGNLMCFVAMSGNGEKLVERVILENLRRLLQGKFGQNRDLICTGTRFKPGFPICEEAYRLMKKCQVFIAVVSESFMRSQYCQLELQEACKQNKPTILIFLGHVETEDMPPYMQEVFRRTSRAWIKQNDEGCYYVVPNLIDMSEAIWDLAIADLLHNCQMLALA